MGVESFCDEDYTSAAETWRSWAGTNSFLTPGRVTSVYRHHLSVCSHPMFRARGKSRSRTPTTPTPTSTPTSPQESFIRRKFSTLHRGDVRTLAVSSIAIASSIGSPSLNQSYPPRHSATHTSRPDLDAIGQGSGSRRGEGSAWQTAYRAARMALDITRESSDMFLPLKAVVGALSVLIKNYDVSPISVTTGLLYDDLRPSKP